MEKQKLYKIIIVSVMILSIIGFVMSTEHKKTMRIINERGSSKNFEFTIDLATNTDYVFSFWAIDEEGGFHWATVSAYAEVIIGDSTVYLKTVNQSESDDSGGLKRAQNGFNFNYHCDKAVKAVFKGKLTQGDQWQVEVYEGLTQEKNMKPGLFIILFLASLFVFFKVKARKN